MKAKCGAKKRGGTPCQKWPIQGRERCALHGGKSLRGIASPSYKHGKYSQLLPARLRGRYEATAPECDAQFLSNRNEIRLLDVQLCEWTGLLNDDDDDNNERTWAKILVAGEARRRLVESEAKALALANRMLTKDDARLFMTATADAVRASVYRHLEKSTGEMIVREVGESILLLCQTLEAHDSG